MKTNFLSLIIFFSLFLSACSDDPTQIDLAGTWEFAIDSTDVGLDQAWYNTTFLDQITLPGSMVENGYGDEPDLKTQWTGSIYDSSWYFNPVLEKYRQPGNMKFPFWLTPNTYYVGAAWYRKEVDIPANWKGDILQLKLERAHWETMVWIDGKSAGMQNSLSVPHLYNVTDLLTPGKHIIAIRVDNRTKDINVGPDSHSITDHTQGNWNGIVGDIQLLRQSPIYINSLQVYTDIHTKEVKIEAIITNKNGLTGAASLDFVANAFNTKIAHSVPVFKNVFQLKSGLDTIVVHLPMGDDVQLWDEFTPVLYRLSTSLMINGKLQTTNETTFGMREIKTEGTRFVVNDRPTFLRGTLECCSFPLTGYPPTEVAPWARIFAKCKAYGLNHMRFHSYCPPEAAFIAADSLGIYLQVEGPSWANHGTALGYGKPIDGYLMEETDRILEAYGNHPSFCLMAYGNEPRGRYVGYLTKWIDHCKVKDPRKLYTGASIGRSWTITPNSEFIVRSEARGLPWDAEPQSEFDYLPKVKDYTVPYLTHEMGQYCVFPNFKEIDKYTGVMRAGNFEMFQEQLSDNHMGDMSEKFLMASGMMQVECYKQEIESTLRTPNFAGFQLLQLNDFSGQGTALVGMLDAFWDEKGYVDAKAFKAFCDVTVPLTRFPKYVYKNSESLVVPVEVAHFDKQSLESVIPSWRIFADSTIIGEGLLDKKDISIGNNIDLGTINYKLDQVVEASKLVLEISVNNHTNSWEFWVYPEALPKPNVSDVLVTSNFDGAAISKLNSGGKVLLLASGKVACGKEVEQHLKPAFWNTSWFKMRPPHTTGVYVYENHPALADFPTDYYSDLQWWELIHKQQVMILDHFNPDFKPIVQPIDTWFINRRLATLFEASVGKGKLMVCSADLSTDLEHRIVARQLRYSLLKYMGSDTFKPAGEVGIDAITYLFDPAATKGYNLYTNDAPDELKAKKKKK